jgi:hypothetical protein
MATEQLKIQIILDDGQVKTGFVEVEKQAKKSAKNLEQGFGSAFDSLGASVKGLGVALAGAFAVSKIAGYLKDSAKSAMEAETALNQFSSALRQIGQLTQENVSKFDSFAKALERTTGVSGDLIISNASVLASLGGLSGQGLERATTAALDLAQALQIDVGTAFDLVAKASTGNTASLSRYGLRIDENIPKSQKFAETLKLIEDRFGGLSGTRLNTLEGALTNLANSFGEIGESIGKFITESPTVRVVLKALADTFYELAQSIDSIRSESGDVFKPFILFSIEAALFFNNFVKAIELGFNYLKIGAQTVLLGFTAITAFFFQIPQYVVEYIAKPIIEVMGFVANTVVGFFNSEAGQKLQASISGFGNTLKQVTTQLADDTVLTMVNSFDSLSESANGNFMEMGESADNWLLNLKKNVAAAGETLGQLNSDTKKKTDSFKENISELGKSINTAVNNFMVRAVTEGMTRIGAALVQGQSAFSGFNSAILNILGDFAIQVGVLFIGIGEAATAVASALTNFFTGPLAIVAGLALIGLGGALKSMAGGPASSSAGGGVASSPSATTELTPTQELTRQEPQTSVQVVVQGDILDSEETGSRVVELINKAFDKKGVVINQGAFA